MTHLRYEHSCRDCRAANALVPDGGYIRGCGEPRGRAPKVYDPEQDKINHPKHYNAGKYEVIDVIDDQGWGEGFAKGNAFKYIARSAHKGEELEDLKKARWYIDWLIKRLEARDASKHDALGAR